MSTYSHTYEAHLRNNNLFDKIKSVREYCDFGVISIDNIEINMFGYTMSMTGNDFYKFIDNAYDYIYKSTPDRVRDHKLNKVLK